MLALPGKTLGTEEEYLAGNDTFAEGVNIIAVNVGESVVDADRRISVKAFKKPVMLGKGAIVYGRVEEIFEPIALVRVEGVGEGARQVCNQYYCVLHVSKISGGFAKSVRDEVRIGDIIKAVVDEIKNEEICISTKAPALGVVKAFCSNCRHPLEKKGNSLECSNCGSRENRKLASSYRSI